MPPATMTAPTTSNVVTPERSLAQRLEALERANDIRTRRAALKRDLKRGVASVPGLLLDPPQYIATMKVGALLVEVPRVGRVKADKILKRCAISPSKTIGGLSPRQRHQLVAMLQAPRSARSPGSARERDPVLPRLQARWKVTDDGLRAATDRLCPCPICAPEPDDDEEPTS